MAVKINIRQKIYKGSTYLFLEYSQNGKRHWESTGLKLIGDKKADAQTMHRAEYLKNQLLIKVNSMEDDSAEFASEKNFMMFWDDVCVNNPEHKRLRSVYNVVYEYVKGFLNFKDINERWWDGFKRYMLEKRKNTPNTVETALQLIKATLNRAVRAKLLNKNPLADIKQRRVKVDRAYLTFEEIKRMSEAPCLYPELKRAFLFSCFTGLRLSDIEQLTYKHFVNDSINIVQEKTGDHVNVPLSETAIDLLGTAYKSAPLDQLVFELPSRSQMHGAMRAWVKASGINKKVTYHTSRHSFATLAITNSVEIAVLSKIMGHSDLRTTQVYAKIVDEKTREAVAKLPRL